jgi:tetratricopeptide (TPR) repeat protein
VAETMSEKPDLTAFKNGIRKAEKANKPIKKFLNSIKTSYKKGVAYFKKKAYLKATQYFQAILKARDDYEEKKDKEIKSPYFEKAEKKLGEVKEEGTKLLIKANAAILKDDFGTASLLLSELRAQFPLFKDIMKKVEQAEEDLQRRMQRVNQGK